MICQGIVPSSLKELSPLSKFSAAHNHLVGAIELCNFMDIASFSYSLNIFS
jgi:hypothetical protein